MKEKCLVTEVMDKCQCEMCKLSREMRDFSLKIILQEKAREIYIDALTSAGIGKPTEKLNKSPEVKK